ncbi:uncharacterized protein CCOS01_13933 [Colletotrichum costaricense]|uniref:Uncharacterized protein n=1 Tax=Colletotrichum costaricense TaxID=1209916 RepID=A0AAI9YJU1_9PEZI|nr:uncharacterized protein CCOS01_13933 [Colletotrichum costaricense]KAK1513993.1 hypothetical protein CCOS01_13933 [Colletotrichum costaricense]
MGAGWEVMQSQEGNGDNRKEKGLGYLGERIQSQPSQAPRESAHRRKTAPHIGPAPQRMPSPAITAIVQSGFVPKPLTAADLRHFRTCS